MSNIEEVELIDEYNNDDFDVDKQIESTEAAAKDEMFQKESEKNNDLVYDNLQFQQKLWTPDAKRQFPEINRDVVGANLKWDEVVWAKLRHKYLNHIIYLKNKGFKLEKLQKLVMANLAFTLNISLSTDGFLRKNMHTSTMKFIKGLEERTPTRPNLPVGTKRNQFI